MKFYVDELPKSEICCPFVKIEYDAIDEETVYRCKDNDGWVCDLKESE